RHQSGEYDPEGDSDHGPENHAPDALVGRELAARKRDNDGVVARQQHIDPDDLQDGEPEAGFLDNHEAVSPPLPVGVLLGADSGRRCDTLYRQKRQGQDGIYAFWNKMEGGGRSLVVVCQCRNLAQFFPPTTTPGQSLMLDFVYATNRARRPCYGEATMTLNPSVTRPLSALTARIFFLF